MLQLYRGEIISTICWGVSRRNSSCLRGSSSYPGCPIDHIILRPRAIFILQFTFVLLNNSWVFVLCLLCLFYFSVSCSSLSTRSFWWCGCLHERSLYMQCYLYLLAFYLTPEPLLLAISYNSADFLVKTLTGAQRNFIKEETLDRLKVDEEVLSEFFKDIINPAVSLFNQLELHW